MDMNELFKSGMRNVSWSLAPACSRSDPEDIDELDQVCMIRVGTKLCRTCSPSQIYMKYAVEKICASDHLFQFTAYCFISVK